MAEGDLRQKVPLQLGGEPLQGELLQLAATVNGLVDRLSGVSSGIRHVAREVGQEGKLGGQANTHGLSGEWRELTQAVNTLAGTYTTHVRDLTKVASSVAKGDLDEKVTVDAHGEALTLKNTVNTMVDQLSAFAAEVTRVSKTVGPENHRVAPSNLHGLAGLWKELDDNVGVTERLALTARHKREALANMTHELRTPLNSVIILSEVLAANKEGRLNPKEVEYARTIHGSGTDLLHLISSLLDMSKAEAGRMQVDLAPVPLAEVTEFCELLFAFQAEKKGVGFAVHRGENLPSHLYTDSQRLKQVLKNLLSNALKFTERGRVELRVHRADNPRVPFSHEALRRASHVLAFSVVDTGIGISPAQQARIFEPFLQADESTSRKYGGTGLGLAFSRSLAGLLGGELHVDSEPGRGSTFTLYLPERPLPADTRTAPSPQPSPPQPLTSVPPEPDPVLAGREVLVASADLRNLFALTGVLEGQKLKVQTAENSEEALKVLRSHPDLAAVIVDIAEPVQGSYETLRAIRQEARAAMPIIALVLHELPGGQQQCLEAGAQGVVKKPLNVEALLSELRRSYLASTPAGAP